MMSESDGSNNTNPNPNPGTQNPLHGTYYPNGPQAPIYMTVPLSQQNISYNLPENYTQTVVPLEGPQITSPQIQHPLQNYPGNQQLYPGHPVHYPPAHFHLVQQPLQQPVQQPIPQSVHQQYPPPQYVQGNVIYHNYVPQPSVFNNNHLRVLEQPLLASQPPAIFERIWSSGLFECLRDEESGWWSFWCCCLIDSRNVGEFGLNEQPVQLIPGQPPSTKSGAERWLNSYISFILLFIFFFIFGLPGFAILTLAIGGVLFVYYRAKNRTEIRQRLGINRNPANNSPTPQATTNTTVSGSFVSDFFNHCCCTCCSIAQESRESLVTQNRQIDYCSGEAMSEVQTILSHGRTRLYNPVASQRAEGPSVEMTVITSQPAAPSPHPPQQPQQQSYAPPTGQAGPVAPTTTVTSPESGVYTYRALLSYIYSHRLSRASQRLLQGFACFFALNIFILTVSHTPLGFVILFLIFLQPAIIFYLLLFKVIYPAAVDGRIYNEDSPNANLQSEGADVETSNNSTSSSASTATSLVAVYEPIIPYLDYTIKIFFVGFFISTFQSVILESILQFIIGFIGVILFLLFNGGGSNSKGGDTGGSGNYLAGGGLMNSYQLASEGFMKLWTPVMTYIAPNHRHSFWANLFSTSNESVYGSSPIYNFLVDYKGFRSQGMMYQYFSSISTSGASFPSVISAIYRFDSRIYDFFSGCLTSLYVSNSQNAVIDGSEMNGSNGFRELHKAIVQQLYAAVSSIFLTPLSSVASGPVVSGTTSFTSGLKGSADIYSTSADGVYNPYSAYLHTTGDTAETTDDNSNGLDITPHLMRMNIVLLLFLAACFAYIVAAGVEEFMKHFAFRCCRFPSPTTRSSSTNTARANNNTAANTTANVTANTAGPSVTAGSDTQGHTATPTPRTTNPQNIPGNYIATISNSSYLKDPYKILLFMVAGAVGFETSENIEYVFGSATTRSPLANFLSELFVLGIRVCMPVHAICAVLQAVNLSKVVMGYERMNLIRVILPALLLHGSFDYFLFAMGIIQASYQIRSVALDILSFVIPFLMGLAGAVYAYRSFKQLEAQYSSTWRPLENLEDSSHPNR